MVRIVRSMIGTLSAGADMKIQNMSSTILDVSTEADVERILLKR
jgi:hypothetical protein